MDIFFTTLPKTSQEWLTPHVPEVVYRSESYTVVNYRRLLLTENNDFYICEYVSNSGLPEFIEGTQLLFNVNTLLLLLIGMTK